MRTTVNIDEQLLLAAKERAQTRGVSLGTVMEDGLRRELNAPVESGPPIPISRGGGGLRPGVDLSSNRAIQEFFDEGLPPEKRR